MRIAPAKLLVLLLALVVTGCGIGRQQGSAEAPERPPTVVTVTNNNWADMVVYVVRSTMRTRLGTVTSMNTQDLEIPASMIGPAATLRLQALPIGSRRQHVTPPIYVGPGQQINYTIQNQLSISTVTVW
jgi:hypothetical protein